MAEPLHERYQAAEVERLIAETPITEPQNSKLEELQSFISEQFESLSSLRSLNEFLEAEQNGVRDQYQEIINELNTISKKIETGSVEQFEEKLLKEQKGKLEVRFKSLAEKTLSCVRSIEQQELDLIKQVNKPLGELVIKNLSKREQKLQNQLRYLWDVKKYFEQNKIEILKNWNGQGTGEVQVHLELLGQETHHGGKSPVKITFQENGMDLLTVVYKPRNVDTDMAILKLFSHLNDLLEGKTGPNLPHYRVENVGEGSIWQYIEGRTLFDLGAASLNDFLQRNPDKTGWENLERLEQICSAAGITDLNPDNIKRGDKNLWVLLDLEVVEKGVPTGLYHPLSSPKSSLLSDEEQKLIDQFVQGQEKRFSRFVPISTYVLLNLMEEPNAAEIIAEEIKSILEKGYQVISPEELQSCVYQDVMNEDVPFLRKKGVLIYYGDKVIAEKK